MAPRQRAPALTPDLRSDIGEVWPDLRPRLHRHLMRLGASSELAEDLSQEVAIRALRTGVRFADTEDLLRWCNVVARNLYLDHLRSVSRRPQESLSDRVDAPELNDVEAIVEHRMSLRDVMRGMRLLSLDDRVALLEPLLAESAVAVSRTESTRLAVRRHRARSRLRAALEVAVGLLGGCWAYMRGWSRRTPAVGAMALASASFIAVAVLPAPSTVVAIAAPPVGAGAQLVSTHASVSKTIRIRMAPAEHKRAMAPAAAARERSGVAVAVSQGGFGVRSDTSARKRRELVCVGLVAGRDDVCVDQPIIVPTTTAPQLAR